jgi:hypothetical protein
LRKIKYISGILLSIIAVILLLAFVTNNKLKGTWIGAYNTYPEMELNMANERIMTLDNYSYLEQGPKYELTKNRKGYYLNTLNLIKSELNTYEIIGIENDSLKVKAKQYESGFRTFHRLNDSLKNRQKINIIGKRFLFGNGKETDTIYFKNDSIFESSTYKFNSRWELIEQSGFQFLFIEEFLPFVIIKQNENRIELKRFEKPNDNYKLTELKK